jgi:hypothetical protein
MFQSRWDLHDLLLTADSKQETELVVARDKTIVRDRHLKSRSIRLPDRRDARRVRKSLYHLARSDRRGRFEDTNRMFVPPDRFDERVMPEGSPHFWAERALALLRPRPTRKSRPPCSSGVASSTAESAPH